jgi:adenylate kinase family enzyme
MIISIYGRNKAGKTTLADTLINEYGFVRLSFADALREIVKSYFGIDVSWKTDLSWNMYVDAKYIDGINKLFSNINGSDDIKRLVFDRVSKATTRYEAYRITMELIGTEVFRNLVLKDIWVAVLVFNVFKHLGEGKSIVVDDMRFDEEYAIFDKLNAIFIRIISPFEEPDNGHESQKCIELFKSHYTINNNKTKKELLKKFKDLNIVRGRC